MPVTRIIIEMEERGVKIDLDYYKDMEAKISVKISELEELIYQQAGKKFDINSSKQVGDLLFNQMKLSVPRDAMTEKGNLATGADVLKQLAEQGVEIAQTILDYREFNKLLSTYIIGIPKQAIDSTIHTSRNVI